MVFKYGFKKDILRKSKPNDDEEIHYLRDRNLTIPKRLQVILS